MQPKSSNSTNSEQTTELNNGNANDDDDEALATNERSTTESIVVLDDKTFVQRGAERSEAILHHQRAASSNSKQQTTDADADAAANGQLKFTNYTNKAATNESQKQQQQQERPVIIHKPPQQQQSTVSQNHTTTTTTCQQREQQQQVRSCCSDDDDEQTKVSGSAHLRESNARLVGSSGEEQKKISESFFAVETEATRSAPNDTLVVGQTTSSLSNRQAATATFHVVAGCELSQAQRLRQAQLANTVDINLCDSCTLEQAAAKETAATKTKVEAAAAIATPLHFNLVHKSTDENSDESLLVVNRNSGQKHTEFKQPQQQRIKVTLSKPRQEKSDELNEQFKAQTSETLNSGGNVTLTNGHKLFSDKERGGRGPTKKENDDDVVARARSSSSSTSNWPLAQVAADKRQSTSTLISSIDSIELRVRAQQSAQVESNLSNLDNLSGGGNNTKRNEAFGAVERVGASSYAQFNGDDSLIVGKCIESAQVEQDEVVVTKTKLSREEQENRLRRIASQRTTNKRPLNTTNYISPLSNNEHKLPTDQHNKRLASNKRTPCGINQSERNYLLSSSNKQQVINQNESDKNHQKQDLVQAQDKFKQVVEEKKVLQPQTNDQLSKGGADLANCPNQLAIYINGKIRSNSIFCTRSVSSNSFSSIIKSFQTQQQQQQVASGSTQATRNNIKSSQQNLTLAQKVDDLEEGTTQHQDSAHLGSTFFQTFAHSKWVRPFVRQTIKKKKKKKSGKKGVIKVEEEEEEDHNDDECQKTYKLNPSSMFLRKAMRYYRLWIYCANLTILVGALIFVLASAYVRTDFRFSLLVEPSSSSMMQHITNTNSSQQQTAQLSVRLHEPSLLLAYLLVFVQLGCLQALGCFGAIQMKEKLIQAFWYLILTLIVCDIAMLAYWLQRYDLMLNSMRHELTYRLQHSYYSINSNQSSFVELLNNDASYRRLLQNTKNSDTTTTRTTEQQLLDDIEFSRIFDQIQSTTHCCGVSNSLDYKRSKWRQAQMARLKQVVIGGAIENGESLLDALHQVPLVPASCCRAVEQLQETSQDSSVNAAEHFFLDDSQLANQVPPRVPAWSPSMVVDHLNSANVGRAAREDKLQVKEANEEVHLRRDESFNDDDDDDDVTGPTNELTLGEVIDKRWQASARKWPTSSAQDSRTRKHARYLTKQTHYTGHKQQQHQNDDLQNKDNDEDEDDNGIGTREEYQNDKVALNKSGSSSVMQQHNEKKEEEEGEQQKQQQHNEAQQSKRRKRTLNQHKHQKHTNSTRKSGANHNMQLNTVWLVESKVNEREQVLSRLVELVNLKQEHVSGKLVLDNTQVVSSTSCRQLLTLRQLVLDNVVRANLCQHNHNHIECLCSKPTTWYIKHSRKHFIWPNELQLTFNQFKLIESYLLDKIAEAKHSTNTSSGDEKKSKRSINETKDEIKHSLVAQQTNNKPNQQNNAVDTKQQRLQHLLAESKLITCQPRSYYDEARIYTRGCHASVRVWLQNSANLLFVTGFCVLTVLKFCSLILLRLEIREMIHKIRVLKGMATEYNALQDLEPYLPRPSVCAQAAELTPAGVTSALAASAAATTSSSSNLLQQITSSTMPQSNAAAIAAAVDHRLGPACSSPTNTIGPPLMTPRRLGGSFSEAVAAVTAVAQQQKQQQQQQQQHHMRYHERAGSLVNCARAASTKTIGCLGVCGGPLALRTGVAAGQQQALASLCPCSTSLSAAHLSNRQQQLQKQASSLRSADLFPPIGSMPRRHTAVSVCPAAAAAAATAAQHLMSRRGTYTLANSLAFTLANQQQQQQRQICCGELSGGDLQIYSTQYPSQEQAAALLQARSLNYLNQHRHSAHTIVAHNQATQATARRRASKLQVLDDDTSRLQQQAYCKQHKQQQQHQLLTTTTTTTNYSGEQQQQHLPLFKRQSSSGAQSAANFSLDITPAHFMESRRSIH